MKKGLRVLLPVLLLALLLLARLPAQLAEPPAAERADSAESLVLTPEEAPVTDAEASEEALETEAEPPEEAPATEPETPEQAPQAEPETPEEAPATEPETPEEVPAAEPEEPETPPIDEDGAYNKAEDVALYIHTYGHLPSNYLTKKQAEALGWTGGSLEKIAPGKFIGGSRFGNYEGKLPDADGRRWTECDVNNAGKKTRGAERVVFSNDGLIYYTGDHYESFTLLYGEP